MPLIIPANSAVSGGFEVANSLRFDDGSSDYLSKTFSSDTNRKTYTISVWVKRSSTADESFIIAADASAGGGNTRDFIRIEGTDQLRYTIGGGGAADIKTNRLFRDVSAWYHIVLAVDTTQGTASNRVKLYVNGVQETSFATATYPSQNAVGDFNDNILHRVGIDTNNTSNGWSGYMSEFCFIDGLQLDPTSFGEFDEDSGIWKPIKISGLTFGTNGFHLEFKQAGTGTNASGIGADTSGEDNHFAVNNLTAVDQSTDTCTNNFATLNPLTSFSGTFSEGNLKTTGSDDTVSTFGLTSGKWYWEAQRTNTSNQAHFGIGCSNGSFSATSIVTNGDYVYIRGDATYGTASRVGGITSIGSNGGTPATFTNGDILSFSLDLDSSTKNITIKKSNGSTPLVNTNFSYDGSIPIFVYSRMNSGVGASFNFGSPINAISSGNQDGNGYGNFEYAVPSGFFSINTKNLAEYG